MNIDEGGGGPPTAAIGGGAAVAILLMVGLGFLYLRKKRMAGSQSPVALTAISLTPTKEQDLESGAPATKGPAASGKTRDSTNASLAKLIEHCWKTEHEGRPSFGGAEGVVATLTTIEGRMLKKDEDATVEALQP